MAKFWSSARSRGQQKGNAVCQRGAALQSDTKMPRRDIVRLHPGGQIITVAKGLPARMPGLRRTNFNDRRTIMRKLPSAIAGVAAGIALALAGVAYAQPCTGAGPGNGPGMGMGHGPGPMAGCSDGPGAGMGQGHGRMGGHGYGPGMGMGPGHGRMGGGDPAVAVESRLESMKAQLMITAAQESSWQAFTAAAKEQAAGMKALRSETPAAAATAPERMAARAKHMQVRANGMAKMASAFNTLYSGLSAEQKAIADQYHGMGGPRARGWGGGRAG